VRPGLVPVDCLNKMTHGHSQLVQRRAARHKIIMKHTRLWIIASSAGLALAGFGAPATASLLSSLAVEKAKQTPGIDMNASYAQKKTRDDQGEARREMKAGNQLSLREIEKRVLPKMSGSEYLGPTYDAAAHAYRLKFIKSGRVMYVDVDARTGKIINRSR